MKRVTGRNIKRIMALVLAIIAITSYLGVAALAATDPSPTVLPEKSEGMHTSETPEPEESAKPGEANETKDSGEPEASTTPEESAEPKDTAEPEPTENSEASTEPEESPETEEAAEPVEGELIAPVMTLNQEPEPEAPKYVEIFTVDDLREFADGLKNGTVETANARVTGNLDLLGEVITIGTSAVPYSGIFEGGNHTISGLTAPLFDTVSGAEIRNTVLVGEIVLTTEVGDVGMLASVVNSSSLINCTASGVITLGKSHYVGGLVGKMNGGSLSDCTNKVEISSEAEVLGGLVGTAEEVTVSGCINEGTCENIPTTTTAGRCGGIIGKLSSTNTVSVTDCENKKVVTGNEYVGGIVGWAQGVDMKLCFNRARVEGTSYTIGGIVGRIESGSVKQASNDAQVIGKGYLGGIAGNGNQCSFSYCRNMMDIATSTEIFEEFQHAGGIVAAGEGVSCFECYNIGKISGANAFPIANGKVDCCYYRADQKNLNTGALTNAELLSGYYKDTNGKDVLWVGYHESYWKCNTGNGVYPVISETPICTPKSVKVSKINTDFVYDGEPITADVIGDPDLLVEFTMDKECDDDCGFESWPLYNDGTGWTNYGPVVVGKYDFAVTTINATWEIGSFYISPKFLAAEEDIVYDGKCLDNEEDPRLTCDCGSGAEVELYYIYEHGGTWNLVGETHGASNPGSAPKNIGKYRLRVILGDEHWDSPTVEIVPRTITEEDFDTSVLNAPYYGIGTPDLQPAVDSPVTTSDFALKPDSTGGSPIESPTRLKVSGKNNCKGTVYFEYVTGVMITEGESRGFSANKSGTYYIGDPSVWFTTRGDDTVYRGGILCYLQGGKKYYFKGIDPNAPTEGGEQG